MVKNGRYLLEKKNNKLILFIYLFILLEEVIFSIVTYKNLTIFIFLFSLLLLYLSIY